MIDQIRKFKSIKASLFLLLLTSIPTTGIRTCILNPRFRLIFLQDLQNYTPLFSLVFFLFFFLFLCLARPIL